jgi:predicted XRE-type DNA-binding protein
MAKKLTGIEKTTHTSVPQMVRETSDDESFAEAFEQRLHSRRIIKDLMIHRATHGLSQKDIAERLECTQSRISKLESTTDAELRLGDLAKYAEAVGLRVKIVLESKESPAAARVKPRAFRVG